MSARSRQQRALDPELLRRLGRVDLIGRVIANALKQGVRRSRKHGFSTEFSDYKAYTSGDDLRFLDWKVYARTDRLLVRKYEAETSFESMLVLDASRSMAWTWDEKISKLEYAVHLFAAMAYLHIGNQDQVGLLVHDASDIHFVPPRSRSQQLNRIFEILSRVRPGAGDTLPAVIEAMATLKRHRGQVVVCSDLEESEAQESALEQLGARDDEIVVLHLLDQAEVELPFRKSTHLEDSESGELLSVDLDDLRRGHERTLRGFRGIWRRRCENWGIRYHALHTGMDYIEALSQVIERR